MAPPNRAEQEALERLWDASRRAYGEALRREKCTLWIQHHERLSRGFRAHAERHERERERYERLLQSMFTTTDKGETHG